MPRTRAARRFARLSVESLETREVPANNLTVVGVGIDDSNDVKVSTQSQTITIETLKPNAILSLTTLQDALSQTQGNRKQVIVSTAKASGGAEGNEAGNIVWDATVAGSLSFAGFDDGKTLTFRTVTGTNAVGNIDLTAVGFHNGAGDEQISLAFDTSATNGSIGFHSALVGANTIPVSFDDESVLDFTVAAGTGGFTYDSSSTFAAADAGGSITITGGALALNHTGGMTAFGNVAVTGTSVNFGPVAGLFATGSLAVTSAGGVTGSFSGLTAQTGSVTVSGTTVDLNTVPVTAGTMLAITGTTSVGITSGPSLEAVGDVSVTGGSVGLFSTSLRGGGQVTVTGTDLFASGTVVIGTGDVSFNGTGTVGFDGSVVGGGTVTVTGTGAVTLNSTTLNAVGNAVVTGPTLDVNFATVTGGTGVALTGPVTLTGDLTVDGGRGSLVSFGGAVTGAATLAVSGGTVSFGGNLGTAATPLAGFTLGRGVADLGLRNVFAKTVYVGDRIPDPLGEATLGGRGKITLTGDPGFAVTADLFVNQDGNLAPGGLGTVGTLTVVGNVVFVGGDLAIDLGPTSDLLVVQDNQTTVDVEGNVDATAGGRLGGGLGTGTLPANATDVPLIDFAGDLNGTFTNAPLNAPVLVGTDVIRVTSYDTSPADPGGLLTVGPVAAAVGGVVTGSDPNDGTLFTAKLTGGGQLVGGTLAGNQLFLVVRNATATSALSVTTKANGSDDIVTFAGGILVNGPLAAFTAPRANVGGQFRATGWVKAATLRDLLSDGPNGANTLIDFGGLPAQSTAITARNLFGSVRTGSKLATLKTAQALGAQVNTAGFEDSTVTAPAIGTVTAAKVSSYITAAGAVGAVTATGEFFGGVTAASVGKFSAGGGQPVLKATGAVGTITGTREALNIDVTAASVGMVTVAKGTLGEAVDGWNVAGGVAGIKAGAIDGLTLTARNLGLVSVVRTPDTGGGIASSTFTLTGNDGTLAKYGLKGLTAAGAVTDTTIDVKAGNVGAVAVGRFVGSKLYLNYTPDAAAGFNLGGAFGATKFTLTSFKTTALPTPDATSDWHLAFKASEIAADTIGTVTLTGVRQGNGGTAFGVKTRSNGAVVVVKAADAGFPANKLNVALNPTTGANPAAVSGDFYFIKV